VGIGIEAACCRITGADTKGDLMHRMKSASVALAALVIAVVFGVSAGAASGPSGATAPATVDRSSVLVELAGAPLTTAKGTRQAVGKRIDLQSKAVRIYRAELAKVRKAFKRWLRANAPHAKITSEYDVALHGVAVELNGTSLDLIRAAPEVRKAQYQRLFQPQAHNDPDLTLISALQAWQFVSPAAPERAGEGVKIAIIDTGIDVRHPCFNDAGYPESNSMAPDNPVNGGTNDKVIYAEAFGNKLAKEGLDTQDLHGHGTHVAGTAACNAHTLAWIDDLATGTPVDIPYDPSGVAPGAMLGNFNVFPGTAGSARSEDILNGLTRAFELGFDVANMSLGGPSSGARDIFGHAIDRFDRGGMVVAVAAGNEGPGDQTVESPGFHERALAVGASSVGHFVGSPVTTADGSRYGAAAGDFEVVEADLTAPLDVVTEGATNAVTGLSTACSALTPGSLEGEIALISRGTCTFSTKIRNSEDAGALAVLVVNNVAGDPTAMASDGTPDQPEVPAYMVGLLDGLALKAKGDGMVTTIHAGLAYFPTGNNNIMAGFSSEGPTDVKFRVKPDVVAPGVNVLSSQPAWACTQTEPSCWAFFQGTSMATPHVAGTAALVLDAHPSWTAPDVRSAIVNTAVRGVLKDAATGTTIVDDPNVVGAGLQNASNAVRASVALDPVSIGFGGIPSGSGQGRSDDIVVKNLTSTTATFTVAIDDPTTGGVTYTVSPASVTLAAGATATIQVRVSVPRGFSQQTDWAWLEVFMNGTEVAHAALYTRTK
jgi:minor extracellular serine protease Vpr